MVMRGRAFRVSCTIEMLKGMILFGLSLLCGLLFWTDSGWLTSTGVWRQEEEEIIYFRSSCKWEAFVIRALSMRVKLSSVEVWIIKSAKPHQGVWNSPSQAVRRRYFCLWKLMSTQRLYIRSHDLYTFRRCKLIITLPSLECPTWFVVRPWFPLIILNDKRFEICEYKSKKDSMYEVRS